MQIERRNNNITWVFAGDVKMKIKEVNKASSIIWISINNRDISLLMILYDFMQRCEEEDIIVTIDNSWKCHLGFCVENESDSFFVAYVMEFI